MASKEIRWSHPMLRVMKVFLEHPKNDLAGSDIWKQTGVFTGTLYPMLMRLERTGLLESKWEELDPREAGRPRKRLYRLTAIGYNRTRAALAELDVSQESPAWKS